MPAAGLAHPGEGDQRVVVVLLLVEPVTPDVLPGAVDPVPLELLASPPLVPPVALGEPLVEPVPGPPMELVLPVELLPVVVSVLLLPLAVLGLVLGVVLGVVAALSVDGVVVVVVLLDEVDEPAAPVSSRLVQAPSDRAATTVRAAAAVWVKDIFIGKLLEACV